MIEKEYTKKSKLLKSIKEKYFKKSSKTLVEVFFTNKKNIYLRPETRQLSVFLPPILIDMLTNGQLQVLSAHVFFARKWGRAPTCKKVVGHTGLSRTHIQRCGAVLRSLGLLQHETLEERYNQFSGWFKKTFFGLTRKRLAQKPNFQKLKELKAQTDLSDKAKKILVSQKCCPPYITPLNKKRGSFYPEKSALKIVLEKIDEFKISLTDFDKNASKEFLQKRIAETGLEKTLLAIQTFAENNFLRRANGFGWQEAVVQSYQDKGGDIWPASKHLDSYGNAKPGLVWLLRNATKVLQGRYDSRPLSSSALKIWEKPQKQTADCQENKELIRRKNMEKEREILKKINNFNLSPALKQKLTGFVEDIGLALYGIWLGDCLFRELPDGTVEITAPLRFTRDWINVNFLDSGILEEKLGREISLTVDEKGVP